jgi:hypothetical protein
VPPIFLLALLAGAGDTFHVHPDGDDASPGTSPDKPWKTIDRANRQTFKPGDRLLFAGGKTFPGNLFLETEDAGVTVGSYGEGRAVIQAGLGTAVLVRDAGGVEVRDLVCAGEDRTKNHGCGVAFINTLPGNARLKGIRARRVEARGFGRDLKKPVDKTVGFQPPAGCGIFAGGVARDQSKSGFDDIVIEGCDLHDNEFYGILITGYWDEKATRYANSGLRIADCRVHHNTGDPDYRENHSGSGILVEDTDGGLVDRCVAWENGAQCNKAPGGPCGIWTAASRRVTIQGCESYRNRTGTAPDGDGFDLDGGCIECVLQYNYSHENDGAGILVYTYGGAPFEDRGNVVRYNVCANDAMKLRQYGAIHVGNDGRGMSGVEIYHNTFITSRPDAAAVNVHGKDVGVAFRNNIILAKGPAPVKIDRDTDRIVFQGNLYWTTGGDFKPEAWREKGKEVLDGKPAGFFADPKLDSAFLPASGSPAVDAGLDLTSLFKIDAGERDFAGRKAPSGKARDVGAIERPD